MKKKAATKKPAKKRAPGREGEEEYVCSSLGQQIDDVKKGQFFSKPFKCNDKKAKAGAIEGPLQKIGFTPDLCGGACPPGKECRPIELHSDIKDDVSLELVQNGDWCMYWAIIDGPGQAQFRATCECL